MFDVPYTQAEGTAMLICVAMFLVFAIVASIQWENTDIKDHDDERLDY